MSNQQQKLKRKSGLSLLPANKINRNLIIGSVIATVIASTPYLFYLYESVPEEKIWDTFLFTYDSNLWEDANYAMWVMTGKLIPVILLLIWFFTCRDWWYHVILVPIAMYIYQIIVTVNADVRFSDEFNDLYYFIPLMAIMIPSIYLIRAKIFATVNDVGKTMEELEDEFKIGGKGFFGKLSNYF